MPRKNTAITPMTATATILLSVGVALARPTTKAPRPGSIWRHPPRTGASIHASPWRRAKSGMTRRRRSRRVSSPSRLSAVGPVDSCGHGHRGRRQRDHGGDEGGFCQPLSPRRPVQDDIRVVRVAVARDGADPADAVAARPNTIDSSMRSKRWSMASST